MQFLDSRGSSDNSSTQKSSEMNDQSAADELDSEFDADDVPF